MRLIKYLGRHKIAVLLVLVLLVGQAFCDLMLPNYTSQIVDVGIQQAGIEHVATEELTATTHNAIAASITQNASHRADSSEGAATSSTPTDFDAQLFSDSYTYDSESSTYRLTDYGRAHLQELDAIMGRPMAEVHSMAQPGSTDELAGQIAIAAARQEYQNLGYDLNAMQLSYLLLTALKMMGFVLGGACIAALVGFIASRTGASIGHDLRSALFSKVISFSEAEMQRFLPASLITRGTNDIQQIQMMSIMLLRMVLYAPILAIGGIIMVAQTDFSMSWLIGVAIAAIFVVVGVLMAVVMPKFRIMQKLIDKVNLVAREMISGVAVVRAFGQETREQKRFDDASRSLMKTQLFTNRAMIFMMPVMMMIMNLLSVGIVWISAGQIDAGVIQTGDMIAFITYSMVIVMGFLMLSMLAVMMPRADVSAQRIEEVLNTKLSITDPPSSPEVQNNSAQEAALSSTPGASVRFDNVSFRYDDDCECVLKDISFSVEPGQTCAFIGSTGSGKTTILKLIERFCDVSEGSVSLDGIDVRTLPLAELRAQIGYVPQRTFLFSGTIESNVGFGEDVLNDEKIRQAIEIAQALEFVEGKAEGLQAPISQGGTNVSGGQRQRLAIARALATDARLLLFDDCFSALDYKTDAALRQALAQSLPGRTQIIVAQRIATVMHADKIIVLDDGRIVGQGTHQELLASCTQYKEIAESQLSPSELLGGEAL